MHARQICKSILSQSEIRCCHRAMQLTMCVALDGRTLCRVYLNICLAEIVISWEEEEEVKSDIKRAKERKQGQNVLLSFICSVADFSVVSISKNTKLTTDSVVIFAFFNVSVVIWTAIFWVFSNAHHWKIRHSLSSYHAPPYSFNKNLKVVLAVFSNGEERLSRQRKYHFITLIHRSGNRAADEKGYESERRSRDA